MSKVFFKDIKNIEEGVFSCLNSIDPKINSKEVLIKPNLTIGGPPGSAVATNVHVLSALIKWLKGKNKEVIIAEGSGGQDTFDAFKKSGYDRLNVKLIDLNKDKMVKVKVNNPLEWETIEVAKTYYDAEYIINIPVAKCHSLAGVTFSIKNLMGVLKPDWQYGHWSKYRIHKEFNKGTMSKKAAKEIFERRLIDLLQVKKNNLVLIDGTYGMEEYEIHGKVIKTNFLICSEDIVTADILCSKIIGFDVNKIYYLKLAEKIFGKRKMEIAGDSLKYFNFKKNRAWQNLV